MPEKYKAFFFLQGYRETLCYIAVTYLEDFDIRQFHVKATKDQRIFSFLKGSLINMGLFQQVS